VCCPVRLLVLLQLFLDLSVCFLAHFVIFVRLAGPETAHATSDAPNRRRADAEMRRARTYQTETRILGEKRRLGATSFDSASQSATTYRITTRSSRAFGA